MCGLDKRLLRRFEERLDVEMIVAEEHPQSTVGTEPSVLDEDSICPRLPLFRKGRSATRQRRCRIRRWLRVISAAGYALISEILLCIQFGRLVAGCSWGRST